MDNNVFWHEKCDKYFHMHNDIDIWGLHGQIFEGVCWWPQHTQPNLGWTLGTHLFCFDEIEGDESW